MCVRVVVVCWLLFVLFVFCVVVFICVFVCVMRCFCCCSCLRCFVCELSFFRGWGVCYCCCVLIDREFCLPLYVFVLLCV